RGTDGRGREPVAEQRVMRRGERCGRLAPSRRVDASAVAEEGDALWLVDREPGAHAVAEPPGAGGGGSREGGRGVGPGPAAGARPSAETAPSIWYAAVAALQVKPGGNGRAASPTAARGRRSLLIPSARPA